MRTYYITGKFTMSVVAKNKEEALDEAYEVLDRATSCTGIDTDVEEIESYEE